MTFQLPASLPPAVARELQRVCMAGGPDSMPWPTALHFRNDRLTVSRDVDESGYLVAPWTIDDRGQMMGSSATLIERDRPYNLLIELARGKVNQVRCQAFEWRSGGLNLPAELDQVIHDAGSEFARAITAVTAEEANRQAHNALVLAYRAAEQLVRAYAQQVFHVRHQRQVQLDSALALRLGAAVVPPPELSDSFVPAFNAVCLPFSWSQIENEEGNYRWQECDALLEWARDRQLDVSAGPLVDFSSAQLPAWLWLWERDLPGLASFMCKFVEATVRRYRNRVRRWQLTAASNCARVLKLSEDDLLGLTYRLADAARQVDPSLELIVGIAQPWGEYMAQADRTHSPFIFADTLIRSGLNLSALDLEIIMGVMPRGSYCRDLMEISRLLDLYALLGVHLRVTLGYPSAEQTDADADPDLRVEGGHWNDGCTPQVQADWAADVAALALCKPYVQGVSWAHFRDSQPHQFPHCGVLDAHDQAKPVWQKLRELRETHLK